MKKLHWLAGLMTVAILGVTGFQLYWLKQNYNREKKSLALKTDLAFRETMMQLQVSKLNIGDVKWEGTKEKSGVRVFVRGENDHVKVRVGPKEEIISTINVVRDKFKDSLKRVTKNGVAISLTRSGEGIPADTMIFPGKIPRPGGSRDYIFNLLYNVDSLRDSLKIGEITTSMQRRLKEDRLNIPFTVIRLDSGCVADEPSMNQVTVGFAKPVTYQLQTGNLFPYLLRQLTQPILFSLLLSGITILSFILLYRNLLRQQRLAELKNEFISNITHELKTPIATVGVAIEALKNFNAIQDPQRTREYLDISANELQRLGLLVDKVLKLSMFEKKEIALKYEDLDLSAIVGEVAASLRLQLEKYHADLQITREGDTHLRGDRLHLLSVVYNLLDNAMKYGSANPVIRIGITETGSAVQLTVADNGVGIPPEYREKIFEKFFRVPHGDTHNAKGYGLGLSYTAQVVRKHGGQITVNSQPDQGSVFTITIPKTPDT